MNNKSETIIAIIGRPNVGKSTLFNRLIKDHKAIVSDEPGTTRDRLYSTLFWRDKKFLLVDTAGLHERDNNDLDLQAIESTKIAINEAEIILFVVDGKNGLNEIDFQISKMLKKLKNVILVINKCDNNFNLDKYIHFKRLGIEKISLVSAISGKNSGDLLDDIYHLNTINNQNYLSVPQSQDDINVSIIGRPNAGKSTLINNIIGEKRVIISDIPGTTRDAQDFVISHKGKKIKITDTAGLRKKSKVAFRSVESYAMMRSMKAIHDSKVVVYLIDGEEGIVSFDQSLLGEIAERGRSIILAINKIDKWADCQKKMSIYLHQLQEKLNFMPWLPVVFISAQEGSNVKALLNQIVEVYCERFITIKDEDCNELFDQAKRNNSQIQYIKNLKFIKNDPPVFKIKIAKNKKPHFSHLRYLENKIRDSYAFRGCPIFIDWR